MERVWIEDQYSYHLQSVHRHRKNKHNRGVVEVFDFSIEGTLPTLFECPWEYLGDADVRDFYEKIISEGL